MTKDADGGYRLSHDVSRGFTDIFSLMLLLNQLQYADVHRLRRSIELQSIPAIMRNITDRERQMLYLCLARMMASGPVPLLWGYFCSIPPAATEYHFPRCPYGC